MAQARLGPRGLHQTDEELNDDDRVRLANDPRTWWRRKALAGVDMDTQNTWTEAMASPGERPLVCCYTP
jgi:hypothetical protein